MDKLIDELEQLADIVGVGRVVWIGPVQVLLVNLAHTLHALLDGLVVVEGRGASTSVG